MSLDVSLSIGIGIALLAFFAEYIDSTLGMGYGTTLTPLLILLFGFPPLQIVPAVLLSELVTGLLAGFTHHSVGNVNLKPTTVSIRQIVKNLQKDGVTNCINHCLPLHLRVMLSIALCSIIGTVFSAVIAVRMSKFYLNLYIGLLVFAIGVTILVTLNRDFGFSWKKIIGLGLIASFNKGMSGGGYGPVVTGGQLIAGVEGKSAVGITSFAEGLTCIVGVCTYLILKKNIDWKLSFYLVTGAVLSVPLSAYSVKIVRTNNLRILIGIVTIGLGSFTLIKLFF